MIRISIVVPFGHRTSSNHDLAVFEDTLASVLRHRPEHSQVIVVHDGSYADPHGLGTEIDWIVEPGLALPKQLAAAIPRCEGELVTLLRPGVEVDENWHEALNDEFCDPSVGSVAAVIVSSKKPRTIVTAGIQTASNGIRRMVGHRGALTSRRLRRLRPIGPSRDLAVYRRQALLMVNSLLDECHDEYLDVELAMTLRQLGYQSRLCAALVGMVEDENDVVEDFQRAHGCAAERSLSRFASAPVSVASTVLRSVRDLAVSPFAPWRAQHAIQRLSAVRHRSADVQYGKQLDACRTKSADRPIETETVRRAA